MNWSTTICAPFTKSRTAPPRGRARRERRSSSRARTRALHTRRGASCRSRRTRPPSGRCWSGVMSLPSAGRGAPHDGGRRCPARCPAPRGGSGSLPRGAREGQRLGVAPVDAAFGEALAPAFELTGELGIHHEAVRDRESCRRAAMRRSAATPVTTAAPVSVFVLGSDGGTGEAKLVRSSSWAAGAPRSSPRACAPARPPR